jgi:predicted nuclease of predicted toxin-antitoxin system
VTHIKLMIDYNLGSPVANALNVLGAVKAKTTIEYGFKQHADDHELVGVTDEFGCILLTKDKKTINERVYPPCNHGGIIIINPSCDLQRAREAVGQNE